MASGSVLLAPNQQSTETLPSIFKRQRNSVSIMGSNSSSKGGLKSPSKPRLYSPSGQYYMYDTTSTLVERQQPAYTIYKTKPPNKVFPHDPSITSRETPGPGSTNPLNGGIQDKIAIHQMKSLGSGHFK